MKTQLSVTLFFLLSLVTGLRAQTNHELTVEVVDRNSRRPLGFVSLQIVGQSAGGTTDDAGRWSTTLPAGNYQIVSSLIGYASDTVAVELDRPRTVSLRLEETSATLSTVTVSSNDASERLNSVRIGVEQLNIAAIEKLPQVMGEVDVLKGLQISSGVTSAGEASNGLSVRGGTLDQNLFLLDDAPIFTPTHLFGLFSIFTPDAVEQISLYRGNIPARYGGRISSVVSIRNRQPNAESFRMQGGVGLISSRLAVETPITKDKRLKVLAAGRVGFNDFALRLIESLEETRSRFGDATLKLRFKANENNIFSLSGFFSQDFYQIDLLTNFRGILAENNQYAYRTLNGTAEWLKIIGDRTNLTTKVISANYTPELRFPEVDVDNTVTFRSQVRQTELRSELDHRIGDHRLLIGGQLVRYDLAPGRLEPGSSRTISPVDLASEQGVEASLFLEDEWKVGEALTLSAGLRYTSFAQLGAGEQRTYEPGEERRPETLLSTTAFGSGETMQRYGGFEPRLGLNLRLSESIRLKAAYSLTRQYLQNIYNSTTPLPTSRWKLADNHVRPQRAHLFSGGLFFVPSKASGLEFSLEAYRRDITDLLEYKPGANFFLAEEVETELLQGRGEAYGIELGGRYDKGDWSARINYTYSRTRNLVQGNTFLTTINNGKWYNGYFDQPHAFSGILNYDDGKNHRVGFTFVANSNRPFTQPNGVVEVGDLVVPLFLERNNARMPVYHRLDFSWTIYNASMKNRRWAGEWTLTAYNLYGRRNAINVYYQPRLASSDENVFLDSPLANYKLSIFGSPLVSLSYSFKFK